MQGGKYFTDDADRQRNDAGRRVLADASALKNEMLSNLVLWGDEDVKLPGGKQSKLAGIYLCSLLSACCAVCASAMPLPLPLLSLSPLPSLSLWLWLWLWLWLFAVYAPPSSNGCRFAPICVETAAFGGAFATVVCRSPTAYEKKSAPPALSARSLPRAPSLPLPLAVLLLRSHVHAQPHTASFT